MDNFVDTHGKMKNHVYVELEEKMKKKKKN